MLGDGAAIRDIFGWDVVNWSRALPFWQGALGTRPRGQALELGSRGGGLSLWLARQGFDVVCSDIQLPGNAAIAMHAKYGVGDRVTYRCLDATDLPYSEAFDVIAFKSVLGGIRGRKGQAAHVTVLREIHKALKPGGILLFAENLEASLIHRLLRRVFIPWGTFWQYLTIPELEDGASIFERFEYKTAGFFGAFGRSEKWRDRPGRLDTAFDGIVSQDSRYILFGYAVR